MDRLASHKQQVQRMYTGQLVLQSNHSKRRTLSLLHFHTSDNPDNFESIMYNRQTASHQWMHPHDLNYFSSLRIMHLQMPGSD